MSDQVSIILPEVQRYDVKKTHGSLTLHCEIQISEASEAKSAMLLLLELLHRNVRHSKTYKTAKTN